MHEYKHEQEQEHEHLIARRTGRRQQFERNHIDDEIGNDEQRHDELWSQDIGTRGQGVMNLLRRDQGFESDHRFDVDIHSRRHTSN